MKGNKMNEVKDLLKFEPNEEVWFMHNNKPKNGCIQIIEIDATSSERRITFTFIQQMTDKIRKFQNEVYKTKEELIKSL